MGDGSNCSWASEPSQWTTEDSRVSHIEVSSLTLLLRPIQQDSLRGNGVNAKGGGHTETSALHALKTLQASPETGHTTKLPGKR